MQAYSNGRVPPVPTQLLGALDEMQALVDGVQRKFQPVGHAEFVEDVVQMVLHRLLADEHLLRHLAVLVALRDQRDDLPLALTEGGPLASARSEEHTSELQSQSNLVC